MSAATSTVGCPWCAFSARPRALQTHLAGEHPEQVRTRQVEGTLRYEITCPRCGAPYDQRVKKAARDPTFVAEFEPEIRMVAFDMLVHHLVAEHEMTEPEAAPDRTAEQTGE